MNDETAPMCLLPYQIWNSATCNPHSIWASTIKYSISLDWTNYSYKEDELFNENYTMEAYIY